METIYSQGSCERVSCPKKFSSGKDDLSSKRRDLIDFSPFCLKRNDGAFMKVQHWLSHRRWVQSTLKASHTNYQHSSPFLGVFKYIFIDTLFFQQPNIPLCLKLYAFEYVLQSNIPHSIITTTLVSSSPFMLSGQYSSRENHSPKRL